MFTANELGTIYEMLTEQVEQLQEDVDCEEGSEWHAEYTEKLNTVMSVLGKIASSKQAF